MYRLWDGEKNKICVISTLFAFNNDVLPWFDFVQDGQMLPPTVMKSVDNFGKQWSAKLKPGQTSEVIKNYLGIYVVKLSFNNNTND